MRVAGRCAVSARPRSPASASVSPTSRPGSITRNPYRRQAAKVRESRRRYMNRPNPYAVATGASSGLGREFAKLAIGDGYDLLIAADEPAIHDVAAELGSRDRVQALEVDLSEPAGVEAVVAAIGDRRTPGRRAVRQCRPRPGRRARRRGLPDLAPRHRDERRRHDAPPARGRPQDDGAGFRAHPGHRLHRRSRAGAVRGGLQRYQDLPEQPRPGVAGGRFATGRCPSRC